MKALKYIPPWETFLENMYNNFNAQGFKEWALLGGAVRDFFAPPKHNTIIKDFDIFYYGEIPAGMFGTYVKQAVNSEPYTESSMYTCTHKGEYNGWKIDFIKINGDYTLDDIIEQFPCNASQIGAYYDPDDGETHVLYTKQFELFYEEDALIFDLECPEKYKEKLSKYFDKCVHKFDTTLVPKNNSLLVNPTPSFWELDASVTKKFHKVLVQKTRYKIINSDKNLYREAEAAW